MLQRERFRAGCRCGAPALPVQSVAHATALPRDGRRGSQSPMCVVWRVAGVSTSLERLSGLDRRSRRTKEEHMQPDRGRLTLSVTEAAGLLGISRAFAYVLVARGELPSLRFGRRVVVPRRGAGTTHREARLSLRVNNRRRDQVKTDRHLPDPLSSTSRPPRRDLSPRSDQTVAPRVPGSDHREQRSSR